MWYVLQVKTGSEARMKEILENFLPEGLILDAFFPLYESSHKKNGIRRIVTKVLFPGYLFLETAQNEKIVELEECLKGITEAHSMLTTGSVCTPVSHREQTFLAEHTNSRHVMAMSRGFMVGREVTITEGAFAGYCGELKYVDRHNRYGVMTVRLGEKDVDMRFGLEIVKKVSA